MHGHRQAVTLLVIAIGTLATMAPDDPAAAQKVRANTIPGTAGRIAKFTSPTDLADSVLAESSGRIGLGTPAPQALLQVNNTANYPRRRAAVTIVSRHVNADLGHTFTGLGFSDQGGSANGFAGIWLLGDKLQFQAAKGTLAGSQDVFASGGIGPSIAPMTIDGTGRVGIGTLDPAYPLDVRGNDSDAVFVASNTNSSGVIKAGIYGSSVDGIGVFGYGHIGVKGVAKNSSHTAGFFDGRVEITGPLIKPAGSFKIDHPLDPANKYLYHSFVESPDMMNVYNGNVVLDADGRATVELPAYFGALNKDFRYQLTAIGAPGPNLHIAAKAADNRFTIGGGVPGQEVSWQVTGIRQDAYAAAHRIPVEEEKPEGERGLYLHPAALGQPESKGVGFALRERLRSGTEAARASTGASGHQQAALSQEP